MIAEFFLVNDIGYQLVLHHRFHGDSYVVIPRKEATFTAEGTTFNRQQPI
jgi:hypothetical protein